MNIKKKKKIIFFCETCNISISKYSLNKHNNTQGHILKQKLRDISK